MLIVVASGNIFRRELSSYILGEAGYELAEARTAADLIAALRIRRAGVVVLDPQLEGADPAAILRAVRLLSEAPILWIADPLRSRPLLMVDERPSAIVSWPFRGDELLAAIASLLARASATLADVAPQQGFAE
jgi:DNA-binding response OmpR family regulator